MSDPTPAPALPGDGTPPAALDTWPEELLDEAIHAAETALTDDYAGGILDDPIDPSEWPALDLADTAVRAAADVLRSELSRLSAALEEAHRERDEAQAVLSFAEGLGREPTAIAIQGLRGVNLDRHTLDYVIDLCADTARAGRPEPSHCTDQAHGGDGGPCPGCGWADPMYALPAGDPAPPAEGQCHSCMGVDPASCPYPHPSGPPESWTPSGSHCTACGGSGLLDDQQRRASAAPEPAQFGGRPLSPAEWAEWTARWAAQSVGLSKILAAPAGEPVPTDPPPPIIAAAHTVWLHGHWRFLTSQMTTPEREAFAAAVQRYSDHLSAIDGREPEPVGGLRWWEPAPPSPGATEPTGGAAS